MPIFYPKKHKTTFLLDYDVIQGELSEAPSPIKSVRHVFHQAERDGPVPNADSGPVGL